MRGVGCLLWLGRLAMPLLDKLNIVHAFFFIVTTSMGREGQKCNTYMNIIEFIKLSSSKILEERGDCDFPDYIKSVFNYYLNLIKNLDDIELNQLLSTQFGNKKKKSFINLISNILYKYTTIYEKAFSGEIFQALIELKKLLIVNSYTQNKLNDKYINYFNFDIKTYNDDNIFYRICDYDTKVENLIKCNHVPFEKRGEYSKCNRFSFAGYPCLYISNNLETCNKEAGICQENKIRYYSEFKPKKQLILWDMTIPSLLNIDKFSNHEKFRYIITYPALLLCNSKVKGISHNYFCPEYLFPQLIFILLIMSNDDFFNNFHGISYSSTHDISQKNIVIPAKMVSQIYSRNYSDYLDNLFEISHAKEYENYETNF